jgi:RimJ/RimL family protein N-acetyltransferase
MNSTSKEATLFSRAKRVRIRPVASTDLNSLSDNERAGAAEPASVFELCRWRRMMEIGPRRRYGMRRWATFYLAETRQRAVAHCVLTGWNHVARLRMVVHPDFRRAGIGRRLLDVCCSAAIAEHRLQEIEWVVNERHEGTIEFARYCGFRPREVRPLLRKWFDLDDGILFILPLVPPQL